MAIDEAVETLQCSLGISNAVFLFNISPIPNTKRRELIFGDAKQKATGWLVGCGI